MNCSKAQNLLSAYHDGELPAEVRSSLDEHLQGCSPCAEQLAVFRELSAMTRGAADPEPPGHLWDAIRQRLDAADRAAPTPALQRPVPVRGVRSWNLLAAAATLALAAGLGWLAAQSWFGPSGHDQMTAVDLGAYLDAFQESPERAQQILLAQYDGKAIDAARAAQQLGLRPEVAQALPPRYCLDAVYQLKMPCGTCVQWCLRRGDGTMIALFEHARGQEVRFADRPITTARCRGRDCRIVCGAGLMVASWEADRRQLTVVGARDLDEVALLMAHVENRARRA